MTTITPEEWAKTRKKARGESTCKGCGKTILWIKTKAGKWTCVDPGIVTVYDKDGVVHRGRVPHHATCPKVEDFRK